ncbi:hypothetical protein EGW08_011651, partial [Elysia chlorotica]
MGAISSCCSQRQGNLDDAISDRATSTPKKRGRHGRTLSATFNMSLVDEVQRSHSLVNVNTANEEELMTLPGISRSIAKSIIEYRNHIGGFRCVEDVALVSGVGAEKLTSIRTEIYISNPTFNRSSRDKIVTTAAAMHESSTEDDFIVCVNTANIFGLLRVKGIGMALAKNIVAYRDTHGKFDNLMELLKVKGISASNLEIIRPYLSLEEVVQNGNAGGINYGNGDLVYFSKNTKIPNGANSFGSSSLEDLLQILGPLAKVPTRSKVDFVSLKHKNRSVFRLATWNLSMFTSEKAKNPGVREAVCMTIIENGFGIVCVQEVADVDALKIICDELNAPSLPNGKNWGGRRGQWAYEVSKATGKINQSSEYHGFLYDQSQKISLRSSCVIAKGAEKKILSSGMPFAGVFSISGGLDVVTVSIHLKAAGLGMQDQMCMDEEAERLNHILQAAKDMFKSKTALMPLGVINAISFSFPCLKHLNRVMQSIQNYFVFKHFVMSILFSPISLYTVGVAGVVRDGLSNAWIPNGWTWGGVVSDHCPVFSQFYSKIDIDRDEINVADVKFLLGSSH